MAASAGNSDARRIRHAFPVRNDRDEIERSHQTLLAAARDLGYSQAVCFALRLAFEEALSNAFHHGQKGAPDGRIDVAILATAQEIRITVSDHGEGFDPSALPDPTAPEHLDKPTGRGVMLMRAYMHEVRFNDKGNQVTLIVRRSPLRPAPPRGSTADN